jgi:MFS family permease
MTTISESAPARRASVFANAHSRKLQLPGSNLAVGMVLMCAAVPRAVLMLAGGAVSDRIAPRRIMMTTVSLRTIFVGAVGALAWLHIIQLWHLYILAFAFGVADAFGLPAF